jgi:hypothetical protein
MLLPVNHDEYASPMNVYDYFCLPDFHLTTIAKMVLT